MAARFGAALLLRLDQALGTAPEILLPHRPPPVFEAVQELDYPTDRREDLDWVLDGLIDRVTATLQAHGRGAVRIRGEFRCGSHGITRIEAKGQPFDPNTHQAVMQQPSKEAPPNTVLEVLEDGYMIHDRVLRQNGIQRIADEIWIDVVQNNKPLAGIGTVESRVEGCRPQSGPPDA